MYVNYCINVIFVLFKILAVKMEQNRVKPKQNGFWAKMGQNLEHCQKKLRQNPASPNHNACTTLYSAITTVFI